MDLEDFLNNTNVHSPDELKFILDIAQSKGLTAFVTFVDDPNTPEARAMREYIDNHYLLPKNYEDTPVEEIAEKGEKLLDSSTSIEEKKSIIMLLAHLGVYESYKYLKAYHKNPDPELQVWADMALDECRTFSQQWFAEQKPVVFNYLKKIARNDLCPCGSGKKFKKCCGKNL